jgi:hypothetical protein
MKDIASAGYKPQKIISEAMARQATRPSFEAAYQATRVMSISSQD